LYAHSILEVITTILQSRDVNLVEESVPTFDAFCTHYISATLSADHDNIRQFDEIVQLYCLFASNDRSGQSRMGPGSIPEAIRLRTAGLLAIKSLVSSEPFGLDNGRQLNRVMPRILETLYSPRKNHLELLQQRDEIKEKYEKDQAHRRRQSVSVGRESQANEVDPSTASATAADLDQRADEDIGILALQSLRQIFGANNRGLLRQATLAVLRYNTSEAEPARKTTINGSRETISTVWMSDIFERISRWAPVQDRFIIVVVVVEALVGSPIKESDLPRQIGMVNLISTLLRSDINHIGLSVMDVLVGLIQHTLLLLQLGGSGSKVRPHHQQDDGTTSPIGRGLIESKPTEVVMEVANTPSSPRLFLLDHLQHCIGDLATHIYYSDQVGDIVSALLLRLKPSVTSAISSPVSAVENPAGAAEAIAASANLREQSHADGFFSFDTARVIALKAVKEVLVVASSRRKDGTDPAGRNRVDVSVWDGTQWLLRDSDGRVRKAYVDALLTWLSLEVKKKDFHVVEENTQLVKRADSKKTNGLSHGHGSTATLGGAHKSKAQGRARSSFLQLLHLAIYENAIQYAHSEADILLLHLLLTRLVEKLGVNGVKTGLPMIMRLQENVMAATKPVDLVSVGSLVHGYFWALSEYFDFDTTQVGRAIHDEIARRSHNGIWLRDIRMPPMPLDRIPTPPTGIPLARQSIESVQTLRPFEEREELVNAIADSYVEALTAPPTSPPLSAGRTFSVSVARPAASLRSMNQQLPTEVRDQLLTPWTKESCISDVEMGTAAVLSNHGSRRGNPPPGLAAETPGAHTPAQARSLHELRQMSIGSAPFLAAAFGNDNGRRNISPGGVATPLSDVSVQSITRVTALKLVLAGKAPIEPHSNHNGGGGGRLDDASDTTSDSLVPNSFSTSEGSFPTGRGSTQGGASLRSINVTKNGSRIRNHHQQQQENDDVPPMPQLALSSSTSDAAPRMTSGFSSSQRHASNNVAKENQASGTWGRTAAGRIDAASLLSQIGGSTLGVRSASGGMMTAPPY